MEIAKDYFIRGLSIKQIAKKKNTSFYHIREILKEVRHNMNKIKIVFASHNKHKIDESKQIVGDRFESTSLTDLGVTEEIPETGCGTPPC